MRKNESGITVTEVLVAMLILAILAAIAIPAFNDDPGEPSGTTKGHVAKLHQAVPAPGPMPQAVRAFVMEARIDSCLPPDRSYAPNVVYGEHRAGCADRPWTPKRQRRYCEARLEPGDPHIGYCSRAAPAWAYPTLLLTKLPELIERICNDDADHLREPYDQTIDAFYRAVEDRERAGLKRPYDTIYWPRESEEIDC